MLECVPRLQCKTSSELLLSSMNIIRTKNLGKFRNHWKSARVQRIMGYCESSVSKDLKTKIKESLITKTVWPMSSNSREVARLASAGKSRGCKYPGGNPHKQIACAHQTILSNPVLCDKNK